MGRAQPAFYTVGRMWEFVRQLVDRLSSDAYFLPAVALELVLIGLAVNWCASMLHGTRGMRLLRGLLIVLVVVTLIVRVISAQYSWVRLDVLYRGFVSGLAVVALIAFQPELRRAFMRAGELRFTRRRAPHARTIASLVESAGFLSRKHHGALIAIQRDVGLRSWAENGTALNADVSAALLNSLFFPNAPLHDLGVIIQDDKVLAASCQFPQAESEEVDSALGSRHRAAIGLSGESDALVLVVSEETGTISLADNGELIRFLSLDDLRDELATRLGGRSAIRGVRWRWWGLSEWWRLIRRLLVVAPLTIVIWYLADQATQVSSDVIEVELVAQHSVDWAVDFGKPDNGVFRVAFRGSTRAIEQLRRTLVNGRLRVEWPLPPAYQVAGRHTNPIVEIIERDRYIRSQGMSVQDATPASVEFIVDAVVHVAFPIRAETGRTRVAEAAFSPPEAVVSIRQSDLDRIPQTERFVTALVQERLEGTPREQPRELPAVRLALGASAASAVRISPGEVDVSLRVVGERLKRSFTGVAVGVSVAPQLWERYEIVRPEPSEWIVDLDVVGERTVIEALRKEDIRAYVAVSSQLIVPEPRSVEVNVALPPGAALDGPARTVRLRLREPQATTP